MFSNFIYIRLLALVSITRGSNQMNENGLLLRASRPVEHVAHKALKTTFTQRAVVTAPPVSSRCAQKCPNEPAPRVHSSLQVWVDFTKCKELPGRKILDQRNPD